MEKKHHAKNNESSNESRLEEIQIKNMICESCERLIEESVLKLDGIKEIKADYVKGIAKVKFDPNKTSLIEIKRAINKAGYKASDKSQSRLIKNNPKSQNARHVALGLIILGIIIMAYFTTTNLFGESTLSIPQLDANTSAGIIFIIGLLTGFHCIGMCGGFVLSYTTKSRQENPKSLNLSAHAQYALGKIISYTVLGGLFGLVGSVFTFSTGLRATIAIIAGTFLILFALKTLNAHPILRKITLPQKWFDKLRIGPLKNNTNPTMIGLANGLFIACGPLQAMYILAMAIGSFIGGATILFAFAIGTLIPMMGFGLFATFITQGTQNNIVRVSALVVLIMGLLMVNNGLVLSGIQLLPMPVTPNITVDQKTGSNTSQQVSPMTNTNNGPGYQVIEMEVTRYGWNPNTFTLKVGVPVKWIINGKEITGCNSAITVPAYNLNFQIKKGIQTIEFTPTKTGTITWSCWMGMIPGKFIVTNNATIDSEGKIISK